jgi:hypothetical protein
LGPSAASVDPPPGAFIAAHRKDFAETPRRGAFRRGNVAWEHRAIFLNEASWLRKLLVNAALGTSETPEGKRLHWWLDHS